MKSKDQVLLEEIYTNNILLNESLKYYEQDSNLYGEPHKRMDNFLVNKIKGNGGYFVDDDFAKYTELKNGIKHNVTHESGKDRIRILIQYSMVFYQVQKKVGSKEKIYEVDDKGILSLTETGGGQKSSTPKITFQRDENFKPTKLEDVDKEFQVGDEREDNVSCESIKNTKYGKMYDFKILEKNIKLTAFSNQRGISGISYKDELILKYKIKKLNVYKGELSYVIDVIDFKNLTSEKIKNLEQEKTKIFKKYFPEDKTKRPPNASDIIMYVLDASKNGYVSAEEFENELKRLLGL